MNKNDLIETLAKDKEAGLDSKAAAGRALNAVLDAITKGSSIMRSLRASSAALM